MPWTEPEPEPNCKNRFCGFGSSSVPVRTDELAGIRTRAPWGAGHELEGGEGFGREREGGEVGCGHGCKHGC